MQNVLCEQIQRKSLLLKPRSSRLPIVSSGRPKAAKNFLVFTKTFLLTAL
jgi:hypothetical protein